MLSQTRSWPVASAGATNLKNGVPGEYLSGVIQTYNDAVTQVFELVLVMACLTSIGSVAMEWRSVREKEAEKSSV